MQKRIARIILDKPYDSPSEPLFKELKWLKFEYRVNYQKSVLMYKCINGISPSYLQDLFYPASSDFYQLRSETQTLLKVPKPNKEIFKKSLQYSGSNLWNTIPQMVRSSNSLNSFKSNCFSYLFMMQ